MSTLKLKVGVCALMVMVLAGATTRAETTFLASSGNTLYRGGPDRGFESFEFDVKLRTMFYDTVADTVYVFGDAGSSSPATIYTLENAEYGVPSLNEFAVLSNQYGSACQIGELFYGFHNGALWQIDISDPAMPEETRIGDTGIPNSAGATYNPASDNLYMVSYYTNSLYKVNYEDAYPTLIGELGIVGLDFDAEWYDDTLYLLAQNALTNQLELGVILPEQGTFQYWYTLDDSALSTATGLAVIPEPAGFLLLAVLASGMLLNLRR